MAEAQKTPPVAPEAMDTVHKGVNTRNRAWKLGAEEFSDGTNIEIDRLGQWSRTRGDTPFGGIVGAPGGLGQFRDHSTSEQVAWAVFGSELYRSDGDSLWLRSACGVSFVSDRLHMFVEGNWFGASGDQRALYAAQAEPSSGQTLASGIVAFKGVNAADFSQQASYTPVCITYFQNRLWKANDTTRGDGNDLAWSELDDGLTFSPANELTIEAGLGGRITALLPSRDNSPNLWILKESAIVLLRPQWGTAGSLIPGLGDELDTVNSSVRVLTSGVGCVATRSVATVPGLPGIDVLFLARDGVRGLQRADGDEQLGAGLPLTYNIPDFIERINFDAAHKAVGAIFENAYHLAVPLDGAVENTHVLRFDLFQNSWSLFDISARDMRIVPFSNEDRLFYQAIDAAGDCSTTGVADSGTFQVYRAFAGDARPGGSLPSYDFRTRAFSFGDPLTKKHWHELSFSASLDAGETHYVTLLAAVDLKDWSTIASVAVSVPDPGIVFGTTPLPWALPEKQFVTRHVSLEDVAPGFFVQFRLINSTDFARPVFYNLRLRAELGQFEYDNEV